MFSYNHKVKTYPDGTVQHIVYGDFQDREYSVSTNKRVSSVVRKELDNIKRAKSMVYDLARSNDFDYFITLTFDNDKVDRYDYFSCCEALKIFTKHLNYKKIQYVIVPEKHADGAFHFHGLVKGDLDLAPAFSHKTGKRLKNLFNILSFPFGFTTASPIVYKDRVASYITKYITKDLLSTVPKGKKRYWASRGLQRPIVAFDMDLLTPQQIFWLDTQSDYRTESHGPFGDFYLFEFHPKK